MTTPDTTRTKRNQQMRESRMRRGLTITTAPRKSPLSWLERRAAIVAKYGTPGMGIAPNTSRRISKAVKF